VQGRLDPAPASACSDLLFRQTAQGLPHQHLDT